MGENEGRPTLTGPVKTVSDMMAALETHIQDVLAGKMSDAQARTISRFRQGQLKTAELQLQYARIFKGRTPDPIMRLIPAVEPEVSRLSLEEQAMLRVLQEKARG